MALDSQNVIDVGTSCIWDVGENIVGADNLMLQGFAKASKKSFDVHQVDNGRIIHTRSFGDNLTGKADADFIYKHNRNGIGHFQLVIAENVAEHLKFNVIPFIPFSISVTLIKDYLFKLTLFLTKPNNLHSHKKQKQIIFERPGK